MLPVLAATRRGGGRRRSAAGRLVDTPAALAYRPFAASCAEGVELNGHMIYIVCASCAGARVIKHVLFSFTFAHF